jgi:hypothetical protein
MFVGTIGDRSRKESDLLNYEGPFCCTDIRKSMENEDQPARRWRSLKLDRQSDDHARKRSIRKDVDTPRMRLTMAWMWLADTDPMSERIL